MTTADDYARRVEREIAVFEGQDKLHEHAEAFHFYVARFVGPLLQAAFGRQDLYEIYAESIAGAVARSGLPTVFSLGCGDGEQERQVLRAADRLGLPRFAITGIELAPAVAERANRETEAAGLADRLTVVTHDLNTGLSGTGEAAAVMVHHVLHHLVDLEGTFDRVAERLHADGVLVTFDMIGRNGHRRWPEVAPLVRRIWAALPPDMRHDFQFGRPSPFYLDWDCAVEGFEGVRAQDILPLLADRFQVSRFAAWGGLADIFVSPRFARNFDLARPEDRAFVEAIGALERRLLDERRTTPASMGAEFRPKRGGAAPPAAQAAMDRALRRPGDVFAPLDDVPFASPYPPQPPAPEPLLAPDAAFRAEPGSPLVEALHDGWETPEPGGTWALLDEQLLRFRTALPVSEVAISVWSGLPTARRQAISAAAEGATPAETGELAHGDAPVLRLHADPPRQAWAIRLSARAYRHPDTDGGDDLRPLAYRLVGVSTGRATAPAQPRGMYRSLFQRLRRRAG